MPEVTLQLAGGFGVARDGEPVRKIGGKARLLLMLLAVDRGPVPMDRIIEVLWPAQPPRRPGDNIATLVSRLRTVLGSAVVERGRDGYRLGRPPSVRVDLDDAQRLVTGAQRLLAEDSAVLAATAAEAALAVLGPSAVLAGEPDADWVERARSEGVRLLREARHAAAAAGCAAGNPVVARQAAEAAVAADRLDEVAHRLLMTAHQLAGERARALAGYERLRAELATELGVDPDPQTRALHLAILCEHGPPNGELGLAAPGSRPSPQPEPADLVGRSVELDRLTGAWGAACAGSAGMLLVVGEGGIGKTRLAAALAALVESTGGTVLRSRCYASEQSLFLQPFLDALAGPLTATSPDRLRELAGPQAAALVTLLPDLGPVLGHAPLERGSAEFELRRAYDAVTHVLRGLAADRPTLLVLDDLHNAGLATVQLLHYLARRPAGSRLLVLATIRAEEGEPALDALAEVTERLDLGPLPAAAVSRLVADAGQHELAETIMRRTRGHTLFVVETLRALAAGDRGAPESLQQVVLARLRRVGPATDELMRAGAVLGATVDPATVAAMIGVPPHLAAQRCEVAAAARLLVLVGRSYEFANDLVQEVIYATTPLPTRVAHHRRAAELLAGSPELVATHAGSAGDWAGAVAALLLATEQATRRFAVADAEVLAGRALDAAAHVGEPEPLARAYLARARARVVLTRFQPAFDDLRAALDAARRAGHRSLEMTVLRELGGHAGVAVSMVEASAFLQDGLRIAEGLDDRAMQARILSWLAVQASNRLRFGDALGYARRAVAAARGTDDEAALVAGLDGLKNAHAYLGELGPLREVLAELQPLLGRIGDPDLQQWAMFESAFPAIGAADWAAAEERIGAAITISRRSGHALPESWFTAHLGWVARQRGQVDRALAAGRRAVALAAGTEHRWYASTGASLLAGTLLELGRTAEAVRLLTAARDRAQVEGAEAYLLRCLAPLAEATGSAAVLAEADALLAGIDAPAGSAWLLGTDSYLAIARCWLHHGDPARARAVLAPLLAAADRQAWVPAQAAGALIDGRAAAALGLGEQAGSAVARALALATRHALPHVERQARTAVAELARPG
jgi:DNA-binding SARP family transcriptional activator/tetratricopeptide (TPR) repeat protein